MTAKKKEAPPTPEPKDICFVLMPFRGYFDRYYLEVYRPAIEAAGLEPHRADDLFTPGTITNDIWAYTKRAKLLLADLSGMNPNVFYELGLAHAIAKPVVLVAESKEEIPFDLRALRVLYYEKNEPHWGKALGDNITKALVEVLKAPKEAVLPAFLDVKDSTERPSVTSQERDLIEIKQDLDLLRREVRTGRSPSSPLRRTYKRLNLPHSLADGPLTKSELMGIVLTGLNAGMSEDEIYTELEYSDIPKQYVLDIYAGLLADNPRFKDRLRPRPTQESPSESGSTTPSDDPPEDD